MNFTNTGLTSFASHLSKLTALNNLSLNFHLYTFDKLKESKGQKRIHNTK